MIRESISQNWQWKFELPFMNAIQFGNASQVKQGFQLQSICPNIDTYNMVFHNTKQTVPINDTLRQV